MLESNNGETFALVGVGTNLKKRWFYAAMQN